MKKMYACTDCGRTFDSDDAGSYTEWVGEGIMRGPIRYVQCPYCKSDSIDDAVKCEDCGEWFSEDDINVVGEAEHKWCDQCLEQVKEEIDEYLGAKIKRKAAVAAAT